MRHFEVLVCNWASGMIADQAREALEIAKITDRKVQFDFNKCIITVRPTSTLEEIAYQYDDYIEKLRRSK